ncbi:C4-dicarboxylate ABC transporter permease [Alsobacter soli]|uniref:TRAP transporter large permease protein n=1 Tax=Alsobacter soli TaxID=2109933 RepID=A0A2T1HUK7_9HYPH|nr:TRAP transporter large permease [Alsobacter soli]PSC05353.1 C4-dicarboxylate ABC transporter permease [Alsobacter soli]
MSSALLLGFVVLMLIGVPIGFAMGLGSLLALIVQGQLPLSLLAQRVLVGADSYSLLAIPFFILAGNLMNQGGITVRIISFANAVVGRFRGGLAQTTVLATMIFSGISGSAVADATALGKVLIPAMKRNGYGAPFSAALMASASVNGPIIPPSIPLVIYGLSVGKGISIAALFLGGVVPGLMLGLSLMAAAYYISWKRDFPVYEAVPWRDLPRRALPAVWAILMPLIILVGVTGGIFTVTESAAVAVVYAAFVGLVVYRDLKLRDLFPILVQTALDSALVMFIIAVASAFGYLMAISGLPTTIARWISSVSTHPIVILMLINGLLLIVGCFMEAIAAMLILIPVLVPIVQAAGVDLVHFGLVMVFNLMLGLLTPPVGILLYICANFAEIRLEDEVKAVMPFLLMGVLVLVLITLIPGLVLWLPNAVLGR